MPLSSGTRVGGYEVISLLGAGGMGEVYRARDSRLQRDVALKILPDHLVGDAERLARFQREAQVLASLAHANIAHIYAIEEAFLQAGVTARALVLELVEGPTLADRIAQGPIPVDEALLIAKQIAEALDAAHEQGIIHRDLKPANIKLREDGTVKVLDFGLAKLGSDSSDASSFGGTLSPTLSVAFTGAGTILGTAAYMAPEQARGRKVDKRADVWAFGCVLFEMLAGTKAFDGTDATEMIAAVVRGEPVWSALPADTPPNVVSLLRRCLQKDPRQRLRDIGDARYELEHAATPVRVQAAPATGRSSVWRGIAWGAGSLLLAVVAALSVWLLKPEPEPVVRRFEYVLPADQQFSFPGRHVVAISSQGHIAYAANNQLYLRLRDQLVATPLTGSGGGFANGGRSPFFSPDGQWLGFYAGGQLKKVSITGGAPLPLTSAQNPWGSTWGGDNTILYGQGADGIYRVSGNGGKGTRIIEVKSGESAHGPQMLPDGHTVLFTLAPQAVGAWNKANIVAHDLDSGKRTVVIEGGTDARYLPTGHLVYSLNGSLLAAPFDASALRLTGGAVPLVDGVAQTTAGQTGAAQFSVTENGTLVYVPEIGSTPQTANRTLVWVDRKGREEAIRVPPRAYRYLRISHDGTRVAVDLLDENRDIGILSLALGTFTPLTFEPSLEQYVVWTPKDERVIFSSSRAGVPNIYWQASNGSGQMQRLTDSTNPQLPLAITPDGSQLVFLEVTPLESDNLMIMPLSGDRKPKPLIATRFRERNAELSPNGRWLAYQSDKSGPDEIWVTPFPIAAGNGEWKLSTQGGSRPAWASDTELLYVEPTEGGGRLMSVALKETSGALEPLAPVRLPEGLDPIVSLVTGRAFDVSKDGRVLALKSLPATNAQPQSVPRMILVQNWFEELKRRVPSR